MSSKFFSKVKENKIMQKNKLSRYNIIDIMRSYDQRKPLKTGSDKIYKLFEHIRNIQPFF